MKNKKPKILRFLIPVGFLVIVCAAFAVATYDPNPLGHWRTDEGRQAYEQAYTEAMDLLPAPSRVLDVPTRYGTVRVYEWVSEQTRDAEPIVLVPGYTSGVPMWQSNLPDLVAAHPVYAMDALGDSGMSVQMVEIKDAADQATWLDETLAHLELTHVHLVGHSFGGWWAANYASRHPQRLASLILLEPVFVFQGIKLEIILRTIPATIPFLPKSWREQSLTAISGDDPAEMDMSNPVVRMITLGSEHFVRKIPTPTPFTEEELRVWRMPVYVAMAEDSPLHDPWKAAEVARENVADVEVRVWPGATHSLPMEFHEEVDAEILRFIERR